MKENKEKCYNCDKEFEVNEGRYCVIFEGYCTACCVKCYGDGTKLRENKNVYTKRNCKDEKIDHEKN